ncbi:type II toxin-antitoxin system PemK/MazF family toxin [Anaerovorax sp. IOR16]|uniref:type II toxin-antitoxin system PemK/MazF family toxin n=1 Tax=Anaerovorax sp. IOR16 TaxID=2773458 RepID=UPI0019D107C1|nr:type II toxin-antitoxin system PemK/MazF family toxin [Anaerovorax sp. IOR16]
MLVRRGEIWYADLSDAIGSEQGGVRPVLIVQNDIGNKYSPTIIAAAITSQTKNNLPTHIGLKKETTGLKVDSTVMMEQVRTLDKSRLRKKVGYVNMDNIDRALAISVGILSIMQSQQNARVSYAY